MRSGGNRLSVKRYADHRVLRYGKQIGLHIIVQ